MIPKHGRQAGVITDRVKDRGITDTLKGQAVHPNAAIEREANPKTPRQRMPDVFCWCQRQIIRSSWERISAGLTESCGRSDCHAPTDQQEVSDA